MKNTVNFMIDIETLGLRPGAVVWQIGALVFVPSQYPSMKMLRAEKKWTIEWSSAFEHSRVEPDTFAWWVDQGFPKEPDKVDMEAALNGLSTWMGTQLTCSSYDAQAAVWAKGPSFDLVQLEYQYHARNIRCPWKYNQHQDVRTMLNLAGIDANNFMYGKQHDALDDCKSQALAVGAAHQRLRKDSELRLKAFIPDPEEVIVGVPTNGPEKPPDYFCQGWDWN